MRYESPAVTTTFAWWSRRSRRLTAAARGPAPGRGYLARSPRPPPLELGPGRRRPGTGAGGAAVDVISGVKVCGRISDHPAQGPDQQTSRQEERDDGGDQD